MLVRYSDACWTMDLFFEAMCFADCCDPQCRLSGSKSTSHKTHWRVLSMRAGTFTHCVRWCRCARPPAIGFNAFGILRSAKLVAASIPGRLYSKPCSRGRKDIENKAFDHSRVGRRFFNGQSIDATVVNANVIANNNALANRTSRATDFFDHDCVDRDLDTSCSCLEMETDRSVCRFSCHNLRCVYPNMYEHHVCT